VSAPAASPLPVVRRIGLFGAGTIGEALLAGLLATGHSAADLLVVEPVAERAAALAEGLGVTSATPAEAAACDVLLLAVKPQDMAALLAEVGPSVTPGQVVVSMAAGLRTGWFEARLPAGVPVVRVMTNTPLLVGQAMSVLTAGRSADAAALDLAESLVSPVGAVLRLTEDKLDAVTALSGSGPAWVCYLVESMVDAGVLLGLPRQVAHELSVQTLIGTGALLRETGEHPVVLRDRVSSPGGSTIQGTAELERSGVRAGLVAGIRAAYERNVELGHAAG
jgi:pyrroline-5-carboxylate reductase